MNQDCSLPIWEFYWIVTFDVWAASNCQLDICFSHLLPTPFCLCIILSALNTFEIKWWNSEYEQSMSNKWDNWHVRFDEMWIWGSCGWWGVEAVSPLWWGLAEPSWRLIELLCRARTPALRWCPAPQIDSWSVRMVKLKSVSVNCRPEIGWRCLMLKLTQVESGKWWKILKRKRDLGMRRLQGDFSCNMHGPQWHGRPPFPHE